jgi:hypothetical protein
MNDVRWSDSQLRKYIDAEANLGWFSDGSEREVERNEFRRELRAVIVPEVQAALLQTVGVVTNPEGLTLVCADLVDDLRFRTTVRRWILVCDEPWKYLAFWAATEIEKVYKATAGRKRPSDKVLKDIERANQ